MNVFTESDIEILSIEELTAQGYCYIPGPSIAPDALPGDVHGPTLFADESIDYTTAKRSDYSSVVLAGILEDAINRLNPSIPAHARDEALKKVLSVYSPQLIDANETFHKMLAEGVPVSIQKDGQERGEKVWLVDFSNPDNNDFLAINQYTIIERNQNKRPDVILFINGIPLVLIELKNPADEHATARKAYDQIQTYKKVIPTLFYYNAICIVSDGNDSLAGTISSPFSRFLAWKTVDGVKEASKTTPQLQTMIRGMLRKDILLDLIRNFIVFEKEKKIDTKTGLTQIETVKKIAAYHQFHAVNKAVESTARAVGYTYSTPPRLEERGPGGEVKKGEVGDKKAGVIWHTQGSGKSLSMVFYTGKLIHRLDNPTVLVITDRNDLDEQLFDTFAASAGLFNQNPVQADSREHLKTLLKVASGGIVFTTIQKFFPDVPDDDTKDPVYELLTDRRNVIVIADEAHRTQYGFEAKYVDIKDENGNVTGKRKAYGFAKYMRDALPNATFIGFTGTPVESSDVNTPAVFGNYIDIYDIAQSVEDGATVKIYYESRLAKVNLTQEGRQLIEAFDSRMEDAELPESRKTKAKWTKLEAIVGHPERIKNLAKDIITHYEKRDSAFAGKAMIVAMSRRIAVALYDEIVKLRPDWHSEDLKTGSIKVVMTSSSSDKMEFDPEDPDSLVIPSYHRTNKADRKLLSERMKDSSDPLKLVIVRDMWLTGFDVPCLHTMYIDKLMKGHSLMQAIARVNRVYNDKPGGLIVDYIGIGNALKEALSFYSDSGGKGDPAETQEKALELLLEKIEVVRQMFHGFDYMRFFKASTSEKLSIILQSEEYILSLTDGKERFIKESTTLSKVFALAVPHEEALLLADEVAFFQSVRARFMKFDGGSDDSGAGYETTIRQIVTQAVESTEVIDIFDAAGMKKPDISLLSEEFLLEVRDMQHKNLALELLRKILNDEIKVRLKFNITESKKLLEMLEGSIRKYQNNLLTTAEIIEELIEIARNLRDTEGLASKLGLTEDEFAFYGALETNDSAVKVLGDETLKSIAKEIADKVRNNATIDWTMKESVRARLMVIVKRTLTKYGYPPDKQQRAVDLVMKQAEVMADFWTQN